MSSNQSQLYKEIFEALFYRHDSISKRDGFLREKLTGLSLLEFEILLEYFCFLTYFQGVYYFSKAEFNKLHKDLNSFCDIKTDSSDLLRDLVVTIGILVKDSLVYLFPHRSIQEYFVAKFLSKNDRKRELYQTKFGQHSEDSVDSMENLWNLCKEIDQTDFYRYLVLPPLKRVLKSLDVDSDKELYKAYLETWEIRCEYHLTRPLESDLDEYLLDAYRIYSNSSFEDKVLGYVNSILPHILKHFIAFDLGINTQKTLFLFVTKSLNKFLLESDINTYEEYVQDYDFRDNDLFTLSRDLEIGSQYTLTSSDLLDNGYMFTHLREKGFIKSVRGCVKKLSSLVSKLEQKIETSDSKKNNLIDFIIKNK